MTSGQRTVDREQEVLDTSGLEYDEVGGCSTCCLACTLSEVLTYFSSNDTVNCNYN